MAQARQLDFPALHCAFALASVHGMGTFPSLQFPVTDHDPVRSYGEAHLSMTMYLPDAKEVEFVLGFTSFRVHTEFGVVGCGTSVVPAVAKPDTRAHELFQDGKLVAKISWPHAVRKGEDAVITAVRKTLKENKKQQYLPYIVDIKCSVTRSMEEIGLPRVAMGVFPQAPDLRVCRTLETVESLENFKTIFTQIVRGT